MDLRGLHLVSSVFIFIFVHLITGVLSDEVLLSCSFETPCGLRHTPQSQYTWLPQSGQTDRGNTGPSNDHTLQTSSGSYIYAPSSDGRYDRGQISKLYTPEYQLSSGTGRLEFYYHMWDGYGGDEMGTLNVYVCGSNAPAIWSRSGDQGNQWRWTGQVDFSCQTPFRVYIEAVRGRFQSDIAIDDIIITDIFVLTTLPPTTKMITTPLKTTTMVLTTTEKTPTTTEKLPTTAEKVPQPAETPVQITVQTTETVTEPALPVSQPTGGVVNPTTVLMTTPPMMVTERTSVQSRPAGTPEATSTSSNALKDDILNGKSSGESAPSFIGPIVVVSVGLLFIGLTLCLAVTRKRSCSKKSASSGKGHSVAAENRQNGPATTGTDINAQLDTTDPRKITDSFSYQELLQQSYSSIDGTGMTSHANGHATDGDGYQDISGNAPGREADLYAAIPEQKDGANEYSYVINPARKAGHLGGAPSAGSSGWPNGNADQEYAAVDMTAGQTSGLVDNQFYVPFK